MHVHVLHGKRAVFGHAQPPAAGHAQRPQGLRQPPRRQRRRVVRLRVAVVDDELRPVAGLHKHGARRALWVGRAAARLHVQLLRQRGRRKQHRDGGRGQDGHAAAGARTAAAVGVSAVGVHVAGARHGAAADENGAAGAAAGVVRKLGRANLTAGLDLAVHHDWPKRRQPHAAAAGAAGAHGFAVVPRAAAGGAVRVRQHRVAVRLSNVGQRQARFRAGGKRRRVRADAAVGAAGAVEAAVGPAPFHLLGLRRADGRVFVAQPAAVHVHVAGGRHFDALHVVDAHGRRHHVPAQHDGHGGARDGDGTVEVGARKRGAVVAQPRRRQPRRALFVGAVGAVGARGRRCAKDVRRGFFFHRKQPRRREGALVFQRRRAQVHLVAVNAAAVVNKHVVGLHHDAVGHGDSAVVEDEEPLQPRAHVQRERRADVVGAKLAGAVNAQRPHAGLRHKHGARGADAAASVAGVDVERNAGLQHLGRVHRNAAAGAAAALVRGSGATAAGGVDAGVTQNAGRVQLHGAARAAAALRRFGAHLAVGAVGVHYVGAFQHDGAGGVKAHTAAAAAAAPVPGAAVEPGQARRSHGPRRRRAAVGGRAGHVLHARRRPVVTELARSAVAATAARHEKVLVALVGSGGHGHAVVLVAAAVGADVVKHHEVDGGQRDGGPFNEAVIPHRRGCGRTHIQHALRGGAPHDGRVHEVVIQWLALKRQFTQRQPVRRRPRVHAPKLRRDGAVQCHTVRGREPPGHEASEVRVGRDKRASRGVGHKHAAGVLAAAALQHAKLEVGEGDGLRKLHRHVLVGGPRAEAGVHVAVLQRRGVQRVTGEQRRNVQQRPVVTRSVHLAHAVGPLRDGPRHSVREGLFRESQQVLRFNRAVVPHRRRAQRVPGADDFRRAVYAHVADAHVGVEGHVHHGVRLQRQNVQGVGDVLRPRRDGVSGRRRRVPHNQVLHAAAGFVVNRPRGADGLGLEGNPCQRLKLQVFAEEVAGVHRHTAAAAAAAVGAAASGTAVGGHHPGAADTAGVQLHGAAGTGAAADAGVQRVRGRADAFGRHFAVQVHFHGAFQADAAAAGAAGRAHDVGHDARRAAAAKVPRVSRRAVRAAALGVFAAPGVQPVVAVAAVAAVGAAGAAGVQPGATLQLRAR